MARALFPRDFRRLTPEVKQGRGVFLWDRGGKRYFDAAGGAVVVNIGHGDRSVARAVAAQMKRVSFAHSSQFVSRPALLLARALVRFAGKAFHQGRVYFCSGGSEAVETALKLARTHHLESGRPDRTIVISRAHSYHGSTLACLSAGGHPARRRPYEPLLEATAGIWRKIPAAYCYRCPWGLDPESCDVPCADALDEAIQDAGADRVSAFIGEPVVGAALGVAVPPPKYWPRIREICSRHGVLLIADEVMTGIGRIGRNLGLQRWGVSADIVALGKGLAGGYLPLAAVLASKHVWHPIAGGSGRFEHGFTCSAHPVSCAAGLAVLSAVTSRRLVTATARLEESMKRGLTNLDTPLVGDVRGLGLLWGLELVRNRESREPFPGEAKAAAVVAEAAFRRGLILYPGSGFLDGVVGDHVMIAPPLSITAAQLRKIIALLEASLSDAGNSLEFYRKSS
jgi:adenosylmethionine-8-amino-7-oxononanoate aminotransferase